LLSAVRFRHRTPSCNRRRSHRRPLSPPGVVHRRPHRPITALPSRRLIAPAGCCVASRRTTLSLSSHRAALSSSCSGWLLHCLPSRRPLVLSSCLPLILSSPHSCPHLQPTHLLPKTQHDRSTGTSIANIVSQTCTLTAAAAALPPRCPPPPAAAELPPPHPTPPLRCLRCPCPANAAAALPAVAVLLPRCLRRSADTTIAHQTLPPCCHRRRCAAAAATALPPQSLPPCHPASPLLASAELPPPPSPPSPLTMPRRR
jgi:hypothetical protein